MGSTKIEVHATLDISVPPNVEQALVEMLREAARHQAVLEASGLTLVFPDDPGMQLLWDGFVSESKVRLRLKFDPIMGELSELDRHVVEEFVSTFRDDVYLDVRRAHSNDQLKRLVRAITSDHVKQTGLALRKLTFIKGRYQEQLWSGERGLNLSLLYQLLTASDNQSIVAAIKRISDMSDLRVLYLRNFVVACKQRGVI